MNNIITFLLLSVGLKAADAVVTWQLNPEPDVDAYVVVAQAAPPFVETIVVGSSTNSAIVEGLTEGRKYYFTLTAFNTAGLDSEPSDPLEYTAGSLSIEPDPNPDTFTRVTYIMQIGNDLQGWVDVSRVVVDNPSPKQFSRTVMIREQIEK